MALQKAMVSSKSNEWSTPQVLFDELNAEFHFTLDPCATIDNAKCPRFFTQKENGLKQSWANEVIFMNPPYGGNTGRWIEKAWYESQNGATIVCLLVSSTDRSYWHDYIFPYAKEIWFIRGRLKFNKHKNPSFFPSAIVIFKKSLFNKQKIKSINKEQWKT